MKSLFKAVATISLFSVLSRFLSFIFKVFLSNQISTIELGVYSVSISLCMIFLTILTAGLPLIVSRTTADSIIDGNHNKNFKTISSGILLSIILSTIVIVFIIVFKPLFTLIFANDTSYLVLLTLIPFLVSSGIYAPIKGYLWGKENFFAVNIVELFEQVVKIILCLILFMIIPNNNLPAGISMSIACLLSTLFGFFLFFKNKGKLCSPFPEFKNVVKQSTPITLIRFAGSILPTLISVILPLRLVVYGYSNDQAMSLIGIIMGMTFPLLTIPTTLIGSLSMAISPKLTILQKQNNNQTLTTQIVNSITFTMFCCFLFVPIFSAVGIPMCEILFNNNSAGWYLKTFSWVIVPMGLSQISTSILNSLSKEKYVFYTYFISSIIIIISILFLPKYIGVSALLVGLGLQHSIISILNMFKIKNLIQSNTSTLKNISKFIIVSLMLTMLNNSIYSLLINIFSSFISMCIIGVLSSVSFIMLCYALNIYEFHFCFHKKLKQKV